jgi:hypothetical protein
MKNSRGRIEDLEKKIVPTVKEKAFLSRTYDAARMLLSLGMESPPKSNKEACRMERKAEIAFYKKLGSKKSFIAKHMGQVK